MLAVCCATSIAFAVVLSPPRAPLPLRSTRSSPPPRLALSSLDDSPRDELKSRFARGESDTKTSFKPDAVAAPAADAAPPAPAKSSRNAQLLEEIRALQPEKLAPPPKKEKVDLNGIRPRFLLLGAASYGAFSVFAWWFTTSAAEYFAANPFESSFYVVQRLSSIARVVVVSLGSLGTGVTGFAALGQLALSVQITDGIRKGELDPEAPRVDPYGGRKQGDLEKMLGFMLGDAQMERLDEQGGARPGGEGAGGSDGGGDGGK